MVIKYPKIRLFYSVVAWHLFLQEFEFSIATTWDGDPVGHIPVLFKVSAENETSVKVDVSGPLFNDPGPPLAPPGSPCPELWDYEGIKDSKWHQNVEWQLLT